MGHQGDVTSVTQLGGICFLRSHNDFPFFFKTLNLLKNIKYFVFLIKYYQNMNYKQQNGF